VKGRFITIFEGMVTTTPIILMLNRSASNPIYISGWNEKETLEAQQLIQLM
jgi:hypothetical protein